LSRSVAFSTRFVTVVSRLLCVLSHFATFCHGSHGKLGWMVAVWSRYSRRYVPSCGGIWASDETHFRVFANQFDNFAHSSANH